MRCVIILTEVKCKVIILNVLVHEIVHGATLHKK